MLTCIFGENSSGKSRWAESLVAETKGPRYYIATMVPYGEAGAQKVEKHRKQRENLGFTTLEDPELRDTARIPQDAVVLLEDISNLLANRMFTGSGDWQGVARDVEKLADNCGALFVVSITGLRREEYEGETAAYIDALNSLNEALVCRADRVYEMRNGVAILQKGE